MWNEDDRKWLYDKMQKAGVETGTYDEFTSSMDNDEDRDWYYQKAKGMNLDLGSADDFRAMMATPKESQPAAAQAVNTTVQDSAQSVMTQQPMQAAMPQTTEEPQPVQEPQKMMNTSQLDPKYQLNEDGSVKPWNMLETERTLDEQGNTVNKPKLVNGTDGTDVYRNAMTGEEYNPLSPEGMEMAGQNTNIVPTDLKKANREQVANLSADIDNAFAEYNKNNVSALSLGTYYGGAAGMNATNDKEWQTLSAAKHSMDDAKKMIEAADVNAKNGTLGEWLNSSFAGGAARGFGEKLFDVRTWDMGLTDATENKALYDALQKSDNGKELTKGEQMLLDAKAVELATNAYFGSYVGRGYKAGEVTAESLPFMLEMCINPASAAGETAQSMLARYAMKRLGNKAVAKAVGMAGRAAADLGASAVMSATSGSGRVASDTFDRMNGTVQYDTDENGQSIFAGHTDGEDFATALGKAFGSTTIENYSEMVGEYFAPLLGFARKGATEGLEKIGLGKVNDFIEQVGASDLAKMVTDFEKNAKWSGLFSEYAEEVTGNIMNALTVGDMTLDTAEGTGVFNLDQNIDTFLGTALMGGALSGIKTLGYRTPKYSARKAMTGADDTAAALFADPAEWGNIRNTIAFGTDEDAKEMLADVLGSDAFSAEQKAAVMNYASKAEAYKGVMMAEQKRRGENNGSAEVDVETSYDNGQSLETPQEKNDARNMYDMQRERVSEFFSEPMVDWFDENPMTALSTVHSGDWSDEAKQAALDYVNAKATYDGMIDKVRDDIDSQVAASDATIDSRTNHTTGDGFGKIVPATMKMGDRQVYVIDGDIQMMDDGSMVDVSKSSESIMVRDAETGKPKFVSPHDVLNLGQAVSAEQEKATAREAIMQQVAQEQSAIIEGVLPFNAGDVYELADENGQTVQVTVVQDNGDGNVTVTMNGQNVPMPKDQVQSMSDAANMKRLADYQQQKNGGTDNAPANTADQNNAGSQQRGYALNDEVVLRDADGNGVRGTIVSEPDADGLYEVETAMPINGKRVNQWSADEIGAMLMEHNGEAVTQPAAEATETAEGVQNSSENVQQTGDTVQTEAMPMVGEGENAEPDFMAVTPERGFAYLFGESGLDESDAAAFLNNNVTASAKDVEKIKGKKPKMGTSIAKFNKDTADWQNKLNDAEAKAEYWKQMKALRDGVVAEQKAEAKAQQDAAIDQARAEEEAYAKEQAQKAAEQAELGSNNVAPAIRDKWAAAPKTEGVADEIVLANGEKVAGKYYLVESGAASASHDANNGFVKTDGFPVDENGNSVNDRDYERDQDAQRVTRQIADNYDSRALQTPVVVSQDGVVLSGNGRTMAGELAASNNTDGVYVDYLKNYGQRWGFTSEQVSGMQHPRVVFVPDAAMPYTAETFAKFNQQEMKGQNKTEQAVKLGKVVDDATFGRIIDAIDRFETLGEFYADNKAATEAIGELQKAGAISQAQVAEMFDGDGVSAIGRDIIENMLVGKAFEGNPDAVRQISEFKSMRQSVIKALPEILANVRLGSDYSLETEIAGAIDLVYKARKEGGYKEGQRVSGFARQMNLGFFGDAETVADYNNTMMLLLADHLNSGFETRLKVALRSYNTQAQESAAGQLDLFSGEVRSKVDILNDVNNLLNNDTEQTNDTRAEGVAETGLAGQGFDGSKAGEEVTKDTSANAPRKVAKTSLLDVVRDLYTKGKEYAAKLYNRSFFDVVETPSFMKDLGLKGDKFTIRYGVISRHLGKDEEHDLPESVWEKLPEALQNPFAITKYFADENKQQQKGYRIFTTIQLDNGSFVVVSAEVKNAGRDIEVNAINTVFGRNSISDVHDELIYRADKITPEQQALLDGNNPHQYPDGREEKRDVSERKDSNIIANDQAQANETDIFSQNEAETESADGNSSPVAAAIAAAEAETDTNPSEAQKEAGNYKKGHVKVDGYDITIENPKGSVRSGKDADGKEWSVTMNNTYGYIRGTEGVDGDHIDVFLSDNPEQGNVYVVDQVDADGNFDEHKVMYGFGSAEEARDNYLANYSEGWKMGTITEVSKDEFKKWIESSHRKTKPFSEYKSVKKEGAQGEAQNQQPITDAEEKETNVDKAIRIMKEIDDLSSELDELYTTGPEAEADRVSAEHMAKYGELEALEKSMTDEEKEALDKRLRDEVDDLDGEWAEWLEAGMKEKPVESTHSLNNAEAEKPKEQEKPKKSSQRKPRKTKPSTTTAGDEKINDVGEKIGGARKDATLNYAKKIDLEATVPSKIFPKPNFASMEKAGVPHETLVKLKAYYTAFSIINKNKRKRNENQRILSARFYASVARDMLLRDVDVFNESADGIVLTDYGKQHLELLVSCVEALDKKGMQDFFDLDISDVDITIGEFKENENGAYQTKDGKRWVGTYSYGRTNNMAAVRYKLFALDDIEGLAEEYCKQVEEAHSKNVQNEIKMHVYRMSSGKCYISAKVKGIADEIKLKDDFSSSKEAFDYIRENGDALRTEARAKSDEMKQSKKNGGGTRKPTNDDIERMLRNIVQGTRIGKDYRNGKDVSAEDFMKEFGFRGVEFGNWATQKERQDHLNACYDALMDLADLIGISPKAVSLGGKLAMAFGSRGHSSALAHYEPAKHVINLTKEHGAGCVAHEWFHAIDNYFGGGVFGLRMKSAVEGNSRDNLRSEMQKILAEIGRALNSSDMKVRSKKLGNGDYWASTLEMAARAFESYVNERLMARGQMNQYLSAHVPGEAVQYEALAKNDPYPTAEESKKFGEIFDRLFDTVQEEVGDDGNVNLFQIADVEPGTENVTEAQQLATEAIITALGENAGLDVVMESQEKGQRVAAEQNADTVETVSVESIDKKDGTRIADFLNFVGKGWEGREKFDTFVVARRDAGNKSIDDLAREGKVPINGRIVVDTDVLNPNKHTQNADHNLTQEEWKNIILMLNDPSFKAVAIAKGTSKDSHMMILPMLHHNGKPMAVVVKQLFDRKGKHVGGIITAYGWTNDDTVEFVYGTADDINKISKDTSYESSQVNPAPSRKHPNDAANVENNSDTTKSSAENLRNSPEFMQVWHGSAAVFDHFDGAFMGSGEGSQVYGDGHYVTGVESTARMYATIATENRQRSNTPIVRWKGQQVDFSSVNPLRLAHDVADSSRTIKEARDRAERYADMAEEDDMKTNWKLALDILKQSTKADFKPVPVNGNIQLYEVEIPDDNGKNYIDWNKEYTRAELEELGEKLNAIGNPKFDYGRYQEILDMYFDEDGKPQQYRVFTGEQIYRSLATNLAGGMSMDKKTASEMLSKAGIVGIKVPTGNRRGGDGRGTNYVIFNDNDLKITDRVQFMQRPEGTVYGWSEGNRIHLTPEGINPNTPIHEYTHLWARAVMQKNPKLWNRIKELLQGTPIWEEVVNDPAYQGLTTDDAIASEALSRLSGRKNAGKMDKMAQDLLNEAKGNGVFAEANAYTLILKMKQALKDFWKWVGTNLFDMNDVKNIDEVTDRVLYDLLNKTDLALSEDGDVATEFQVVTDKQVNTPQFKKWFGDWEKDPEHSSKVVDADGKPLVVYHGTQLMEMYFKEGRPYTKYTERFNTFNDGKGFFTSDKDAAESFARGKQGLYETYLNIRNPYVIDCKGKDWDAIEGYENPEGYTTVSTDYIVNDIKRNHPEYDGVIFKNVMNENNGVVGYPIDDYVPFKASQIKSATENNGEFDAENADIRFRERTEFDDGEVIDIVGNRGAQDFSLADSTMPSYSSKEELLHAFQEKHPAYAAVLTADGNGIEVTAWKSVLDKNIRKPRRRNGEPTKAEKQRAAYVERKTQIAIANVNEKAQKLGLNVEVITDTESLPEKMADKKGWYNKVTGKITIVLPNHSNGQDVMRTLMHEGVAHHGLRQMFGEDFNTFLNNVYANADIEVRRRIAELAARKGWDFHTATEEYLAALAEDIDFERKVDQTWWQKVRNFFVDMLRKAGIVLDTELTDNDLRYIVWKSYERMAYAGDHGAIRDARTVMMDQQLGTGNFGTRAVADGSQVADGSELQPSTAADGSELLYRDGDRMDQRDHAAIRDSYEREIKTVTYQMREAVQDSMLSLRRMMEEIEKATGNKIADYENAYMAENALSSKNLDEQRMYKKMLFEPMLDEVYRLAKEEDANGDKEGRDGVTRYMMAKHGLERQKLMEARAEQAGEKSDRDFAGLTGLFETDDLADAIQQAEQLVSDFEAAHEVDDLWKKVNNCSKSTLEKSYKCGIISKEGYERISKMYDFYIPLRGFKEDTSDKIYAYLNHETGSFQSPVRGAFGRETVASDIFANILNMADSAIAQGNKNLVKQKFLKMVMNHPTDLASVNKMWLKKNDITGEWEAVTAQLKPNDSAEQVFQKTEAFEENMAQLAESDPDHYKRGKDLKDIPYRVLGNNLSEHQVYVKMGGQDYIITINGNPRVAQAVNGLSNPDSNSKILGGKLVDKVRSWTRWMAQNFTTRNPEFVLSNFLRDATYANTTIRAKEPKNYAVRYNQNFSKVGKWGLDFGKRGFGFMLPLLMKYEKGTLDMNNEMEKAFKEFMQNGGETGYTHIRSVEENEKDVEKYLKMKDGKAPLTTAYKWLTEHLDYINRSVENRARFAAFLTSRQMGRTVERSVMDAKEVSVNFNKKGAGSQYMDKAGQTRLGNAVAGLTDIATATHVFFNAGVQGDKNFAGVLKHAGAKAVKYVAYLFLAGLANAAWGGGDDDKYKNLTPYERRNNICFKVPGTDMFVKIPLGVEFRTIYGLGELAGSMIRGYERMSPEEIMSEIAGLLSQVSPIDIMEGGKPKGKNLLPSLVRPEAELYDNEDFMGRRIHNKTDWNGHLPEWKRAGKHTNASLIKLSRKLNEWTQFTDEQYIADKGLININPSVVEHLVEGHFGGLATFFNKGAKVVEYLFSDEGDDMPKELELRNIPMASRVLTTADENAEARRVNNEFYKYYNEYLNTKKLVNMYSNQQDEGILGMAEKLDFMYNSPEYGRYEIVDEYYDQVKDLTDKLKETVEPDERQMLEEEITDLKREMIEAVRAYDDARNNR